MPSKPPAAAYDTESETFVDGKLHGTLELR